MAMATGGWFLQRGVGAGAQHLRERASVRGRAAHVSDSFVDRRSRRSCTRWRSTGCSSELGDPHTSLMPAGTTSSCGCRRRASTAGSARRSTAQRLDHGDRAAAGDAGGARAGLQAGDQIIEVDGESTRDWGRTWRSASCAGRRARGGHPVARSGVDQPIPVRDRARGDPHQGGAVGLHDGWRRRLRRAELVQRELDAGAARRRSAAAGEGARG
jgi:hypothetical protein